MGFQLVFTLRLSVKAISFVVLPSATSCRISRWRGVNCSNWFFCPLVLPRYSSITLRGNRRAEVSVTPGHRLYAPVPTPLSPRPSAGNGRSGAQRLQHIFLIGMHREDRSLAPAETPSQSAPSPPVPFNPDIAMSINTTSGRTSSPDSTPRARPPPRPPPPRPAFFPATTVLPAAGGCGHPPG